MTLQEYLTTNKLTQSQFSRLCGVPQTLISRYILGKGYPSFKNLSLIIKATKGQVSEADFERHHD